MVLSPTEQPMKSMLYYRNSLVIRLVLAFILVAVPSVLASSAVATRLATQAFNKTIESWLRETTEYVLLSMKEAEQELDGGFTLLQHRFTTQKIAFSPEEIAAMQKIGIENLLVRDESGAELFSAGQIGAIDEKPLYPGSKVRWMTTKKGERQLAFALERSLQVPGAGKRTVSVADVLSLDLYTANKGASSLVLHIFIPKEGGFEQAFSSGEENFAIPEHIAKILYSGVREYFLPDHDWADDRHDMNLFFRTLRDNKGNIQALFVSGIKVKGLDRFAADASLLFWSLFLGGLLVSSSIGYVLARHIVKPIKNLDAGVTCVASGNFGYEVPVSGNDEIAGLGRGFNMMARQLEIMQRDKAESVKRERARMLGEIALGFAHEIRNPLLVIKTSAEVLHGRLPKDKNDTRLLGFVVEEVERINKLVSEFLGFAKPGLPEMTPGALSELVDTAAALCRAKFEQRNVTYVQLQETEKDIILCDARQMQQILLNLILNAVDAMPDGGTLTMRIYEHGGQICLDVADTGQGIDSELLPTIHLPFVSTKKGGLGLGLSTVYVIVEEHGWTISCASSAGHGTTFTLCMKGSAEEAPRAC